VAKRFTVKLLGTGMPSFYVADLGDMNFTLGLSGWTANDWSRSGNFDLLAPRQEIDHEIKQTVFKTLKKHWFAGLPQLVQETGYDAGTITGALTAYTQAGRVIYDINNKVYRVRELTKEPLSLDQLRFASPQEEAAAKLLNDFAIDCKKEDLGEGYKLRATVKTKRKNFNAELIIDGDERIIGGNCDCSFYVENKLHKGPCEHMLAMRQAYNKTKEKLFAG
jgi:predicted nucleic acid-binding Zn finger protein